MAVIQVDAEVLRWHASRVSIVSDEVRVAQDATRQVNLSGGAFGVLCAFMVPPASMVQSAASDALGEVIGLLERTQTELKAAASNWEMFEDDAVQRITALQRVIW